MHPHFIPSNHAGTRRDTAVLLVGTAREFGIDQHDIVLAQGGFRISDALHTVLYDEQSSNTNSSSGNRAAKRDSQKGN